MHHERVRDDLAEWSAPFSPVNAEEFEQLDQGQFTAIDGDDGGVWSPSSPIEIGGAGVLMSGPFEANGDSLFSGPVEFDAGSAPIFNDGATFNHSVEFNEDVTIGSASNDLLTVIAEAEFENDVTIGSSLTDVLTVLGESDFSGTALFHGDVQIGVGGGEELEINADVQLDGDYEFNGNGIITGDIEMTGSLELDGTTLTLANATALHFSGSSRITGTPNLARPLAFSQTGRVPRRPIFHAGNHTYTVADGDLILADGTSTITLDETDATAGDSWLILKESTSSVVTVALPVSGTIVLPAGDNWLCLVVPANSVPNIWHAYAWKADIFDNGA